MDEAVHLSTTIGRLWAIRVGAGLVLKNISKEFVLAGSLRGSRADMFQTWKLIPPPNENHFRTYDPSLYPKDCIICSRIRGSPGLGRGRRAGFLSVAISSTDLCGGKTI